MQGAFDELFSCSEFSIVDLWQKGIYLSINRNERNVFPDLLLLLLILENNSLNTTGSQTSQQNDSYKCYLLNVVRLSRARTLELEERKRKK